MGGSWKTSADDGGLVGIVRRTGRLVGELAGFDCECGEIHPRRTGSMQAFRQVGGRGSGRTGVQASGEVGVRAGGRAGGRAKGRGDGETKICPDGEKKIRPDGEI